MQLDYCHRPALSLLRAADNASSAPRKKSAKRPTALCRGKKS